jgi:hypothetical protein
MQPCNRIYYSTFHWRLNMFRTAYRSSSGALIVFAASGSKHVEPSMNGAIINSITRLHLVGSFYWVYLGVSSPENFKSSTRCILECTFTPHYLNPWSHSWRKRSNPCNDVANFVEGAETITPVQKEETKPQSGYLATEHHQGAATSYNNNIH